MTKTQDIVDEQNLATVLVAALTASAGALIGIASGAAGVLFAGVAEMLNGLAAYASDPAGAKEVLRILQFMQFHVENYLRYVDHYDKSASLLMWIDRPFANSAACRNRQPTCTGTLTMFYGSKATAPGGNMFRSMDLSERAAGELASSIGGLFEAMGGK